MTSRSAFAGVAITAALVLAPSAAYADKTCDAYSDTCVKPFHEVKPPTVVEGTNQTLPFTGAELVLMTVVGGGAIGAGAAFVVAGRRRRLAAV